MSASERMISASELTPFLLNLQKASAMLTQLEADLQRQSAEALSLGLRLQTAYDELERLKHELADLLTSLTSSEAQRQALATDLLEASTSLNALTGRYYKLSQDFSDYRVLTETELKKARCGRDAWMVTGLISVVIAVVAGVAAFVGR